MKKDELISLGLDEDTAAKILAINGADIEHAKRSIPSLTQERDTYKSQLEEAIAKLKSFDGVDVAGLNTRITELTGSLTKAQTEYQQQLAEQQHDFILKTLLGGVKIKGKYAQNAIFEELKKKGLKVEGDTLIGFTEALTAIKTADPDAFEAEQAPPDPRAVGVEGSPTAPADGGGSPMTKETFQKLSYEARVAYKEAHPADYRVMMQ